jgi:tetratricopeptide (TPR) repeat protein
MPSKLTEAQDVLAAFVRQDEHQVLVVRATDVELIYFLKIVQALDQVEPAHVFGLFADPVAADAGAYVTSVLDGLRAQLDPVNQLRVADGQAPWPPLPPECGNPAVQPARRLRSGVAHAATLVPGSAAHRLVFCLLPQKIEKPRAYADAIAGLLPPQKAPPEPEWPRVRLILRDDGTAPHLIEALRRSKNPDVLIYEPDLSPPALMDAMARDVADPGVPEPQRMQMLTQLASLDYAYGRLEEASAKYELLYDYYRREKSPAMQALVLQGIGDVLRRVGRVPLARERYAQGLTLALETQALPLMLSLAYAVGDASLTLRQYQDAEEHLEIARKIAVNLRNRGLEADSLEKIGDARVGLKRPGEALKTWRDCANVCRGAKYKERLLSVLDRMSKMYASGRMLAEQRACDSEIAAVNAGAPIKAPPPAPPKAAPGPRPTGPRVGGEPA